LINAAIVITDQAEYVNSRIQIDAAEDFGFVPVNMPHLITLLKNTYLAPIIRSYPTDIVSGNYHGSINGNKN